MARPCFIKKASNPPACGVHKVPLVRKESSESFVASKFGDFNFLVCPVSNQVVDTPPTCGNSS